MHTILLYRLVSSDRETGAVPVAFNEIVGIQGHGKPRGEKEYQGY